MSFVSRMVERVLKWRRFRPPKTYEERLTSLLFQPYLGILEDIIFWKNPVASICVIGAVNIIFLLLWQYDFRILGIFCGVLLLKVMAEGASTWLLKRAGSNEAARLQIMRSSTENSGAVLSAAIERAQQWLVSRKEQLLTLRDENPQQFCLLIVAASVGTGLLGKYVNGVPLLYLGSMVLLLAPGLAPKALSVLKGFYPQTDSEEVEGFMPEMSPQAIAELHKAGDVAPMAVMEVDKMFDVWLPENSVNGDGNSSSDDGSNGKSLPSILDAPPDISDSSSSHSSDEEFLPRHISVGDRGQLQEHPIPSAPPQISSSLSGWSESALGALGSLTGAIGTILPGSAPQVPVKRYSENDSDSDEFELVDKDNL